MMFVHDGSPSVIVGSLLGPPGEAPGIVPDLNLFVSGENVPVSPYNGYVWYATIHVSPSILYACHPGLDACSSILLVSYLHSHACVPKRLARSHGLHV